MRSWHGCWLAWLLLGCSDSAEEALQTWMQSQRTAARAQTPSRGVSKAFVPQAYVVADLSEPFDVRRLQRAWPHGVGPGSVAGVAPEPGRRPEALESFPLESITMVGSLEQRGRKTALLRVGQQLYSVQIGQYLGLNHGRVVQIAEERLLLRERVQDGAGVWSDRMATLELQEGGR